MYLEPIERAARRREPSVAPFERRGARAGGAASGRRIGVWAECAILFLCLPLAALAAGGAFGFAAPTLVGSTVAAGAALLSGTRSFQWRDLAPVDPLSEWRLFLGLAVFAAAAIWAATYVFAPERLFSANAADLPRLVGGAGAAALAAELAHRALLHRRLDRRFPSERWAIAVGAAATAFFYALLAQSLAGALFGAAAGAALGWSYRRTGQFALCAALHWFGAVCVWLIGPGF
ncbi:MAG: CPBP family glutamic-type intramembrane protease [Pseudomonadota bacterium]